MPCKPSCDCQCGRMSCECWDGITFERFERETEEETKTHEEKS